VLAVVARNNNIISYNMRGVLAAIRAECIATTGQVSVSGDNKTAAATASTYTLDRRWSNSVADVTVCVCVCVGGGGSSRPT
jgi:hypothetical protein